MNDRPNDVITDKYGAGLLINKPNTTLTNSITFFNIKNEKQLEVNFDTKEITAYGGWLPDSIKFLEFCEDILRSKR